MSNSYGVDANKGAANVSNPYDFKIVQVSLNSHKMSQFDVFIVKTTTFFISKQRWTVQSWHDHSHETRYRSTKTWNRHEIQCLRWFQKQATKPRSKINSRCQTHRREERKVRRGELQRSGGRSPQITRGKCPTQSGQTIDRSLNQSQRSCFQRKKDQTTERKCRYFGLSKYRFDLLRVLQLSQHVSCQWPTSRIPEFIYDHPEEQTVSTSFSLACEHGQYLLRTKEI